MSAPPETCEQRVDQNLAARLADIRKMWARRMKGLDPDEDLGDVFDYGLSFDYVTAGTFKDVREGFFRWQISTGGPGDEFRFFADPGRKVHRIEYRFLDWYDGAGRDLSGKDYDLLMEFFEELRELAAVEKALSDAEA